MKRDCEVCGGRGRVRLPLYPKVAQFRRADTPIGDIGETSREFSCPECSDTVSQERLWVVTEHSTVDSRIDDPRYVEMAHRQAAHAMVDELIRSGHITFETGRSDDGRMMTPIRATLGVVAPKAVATLEERVAERQTEVARMVTEEAARQISVWGSHFTGNEGHIRKAQAIDAVREALVKVLAEREAFRKAMTTR